MWVPLAKLENGLVLLLLLTYLCAVTTAAASYVTVDLSSFHRGRSGRVSLGGYNHGRAFSAAHCCFCGHPTARIDITGQLLFLSLFPPAVTDCVLPSPALAHPQAALGLDRIKMMVTGSAPVAAHVLTFMRILVGVPLLEG